MNDIKKISELNGIEEIQNDDLLLVSKAEQYRRYTSKFLKYSGLVESIRRSFDAELQDLAYINDNFVDDSTMTFSYDQTTKKIILKTDAHTREIDATDFIYSGMIDSVSYDARTHKITITFNTKSGKEPVVIDLSDLIDVYSAGNGLCCENHIFSIDEDVVSKVGHNHDLSDVNNISQLSAEAVGWVQKQNYLTEHQSLSDYYTKNETSSSIDLNKKFQNYQLTGNYIEDTEISISYNKLQNTLWLSAGSKLFSTQIPTSGGGSGITYDEVKNQLSNDGYGLKVTFREWN